MVTSVKSLPKMMEKVGMVVQKVQNVRDQDQ